MTHIVDERYTRHPTGELLDPDDRLRGRGDGERIWKRRGQRPGGPDLRHRMHAAWDIPGPEGTPVRAVLDGEAVWAGMIAGYGHTVILLHRTPPSTTAAGGDRPLTTAYCHMDAEAVALGDRVSAGDEIGQIGCTYWDLSGSTGGVGGIDTHLHFSAQLVEPHPDRTYADRWQNQAGWRPRPRRSPRQMLGAWEDGNLTVRTGRRFPPRRGRTRPPAVVICRGYSSHYEEDWSRQIELTSWLAEIYGASWQEAARFLGPRSENETAEERRERIRRRDERRRGIQP